MSGADILRATGLAEGELDILDGSPPCASFSMAGKRAAGWGEVKAYSETRQRTDDLFLEYIRIVRELKPKRFIAENVSGLVKGVGKGWFLEILAALKGAGYRVEARLLDAQWLGVPQARQRLFFVGVRDDLDAVPGFPAPLPYRYSVRDALPWIDGLEWHSGGMEGSRTYDVSREPLQTLRAGGGGAQKDFRVTASRPVRIRHGNKAPFDAKGQPLRLDRPLPTVMGGDTLGCAPFQFEVEAESDMRSYAVGEELGKLAPGEQSAKYFQLVRAPLNAPSQTITARGGDKTAASVAHPVERRKFSIAELRRICGFPDDFILTGTYAQQWERLGRAVPPPMMAALVRANLGQKKSRLESRLDGVELDAA